jgi:uncharacterized protein (DUF433 family)
MLQCGLGVKSMKNLTDRIEINPKVMLGKPIIRGTRVPIEVILRKLSEGASVAQLCEAYPRLASEDVMAALAYAASSLAHEESRWEESPALT